MIRGRRLRNLAPHLAHVRPGTTISFGVAASARGPLLQEIGFSAISAGETVLPRSSGPVSTFNAEGKFIVHKDRPKERAYRLIEWSWKEWHGRYEEEKTDIREVGYERYPRTFVPPPSVELQLATSTSGELLVCTAPISFSKKGDGEHLLHTVNLLLELFGECEIFDESRNRVLRAPVRRLNWELLPPGGWPWERLRSQLNPIVQLAAGGNRSVVEWRFEIINQYEPSFVAVGRGGFRGYVVFAFPERNLFVLECVFTGNATYVLGQNWEAVAQLTKAEILDESLHLHRLIHRKSWHPRVQELLRPTKRTT